MSIIGDRIRQRREELGMTQAELAERMGYRSRSSINKIEMGQNDVVQSKVKKFANALDTSVSYLMGWDDGQVSVKRNLVTIDERLDEAMKEDGEYYIDKRARELAEFLRSNPEYAILFDAAQRVKPEDLEFVRQFIDKMTK